MLVVADLGVPVRRRSHPSEPSDSRRSEKRRDFATRLQGGSLQVLEISSVVAKTPRSRPASLFFGTCGSPAINSSSWCSCARSCSSRFSAPSARSSAWMEAEEDDEKNGHRARNARVLRAMVAMMRRFFRSALARSTPFDPPPPSRPHWRQR